MILKKSSSSISKFCIFSFFSFSFSNISSLFSYFFKYLLDILPKGFDIGEYFFSSLFLLKLTVIWRLNFLLIFNFSSFNICWEVIIIILFILSFFSFFFLEFIFGSSSFIFKFVIILSLSIILLLLIIFILSFGLMISLLFFLLISSIFNTLICRFFSSLSLSSSSSFNSSIALLSIRLKVFFEELYLYFSFFGFLFEKNQKLEVFLFFCSFKKFSEISFIALYSGKNFLSFIRSSKFNSEYSRALILIFLVLGIFKFLKTNFSKIPKFNWTMISLV